MAIAFNAVTSSVATTFAAGAVTTFAHTTAGASRALVVTIAIWQDVAGAGTVSGITYAGVAMTKIQGVTQAAMRSEIWVLANPTVGANNVAVTVSGNTDSRKFAAISFTGVDQSTPSEASNSAVGATANSSVSVTTLTAGAMLVDSLSKFGVTAQTIGAGQTSDQNDVTGSASGAASHKLATTATSYSMSWTFTGTNDRSQTVVALKQAVATPFIAAKIFVNQSVQRASSY